MVEKDIQTIFTHWVEANKDTIPTTTAWELKLEKGKSFSFGKVADHQIIRLLEAKYDGVYHKITDQPWMPGRHVFTKPKPFDCFLIKKSKAYVVLCFYKPRQIKETYWIDIDQFIKTKTEHPRKSIREPEVRKIADRIQEI